MTGRRALGALGLVACVACGATQGDEATLDTIDLTTLRTGFVEQAPIALDLGGTAGDRRLVQTGAGTLDLYVRTPARAELRYALPPDVPPEAVSVEIAVGGERRSLTPTRNGAEWRAELGDGGGRIVQLRLSATRPTAWLHPRIVGGSLPTAVPTLASSLRPPPGPVNVILYIVDTLRRDRLSAYGYQRPTTPRLTALAREGLLFRNAYAAGAFTSPSVTALMASRFPSELGGRLARERGADRTLAELFRESGYATAGIQANFLLTGELGYDRGFDHYEILTDPTSVAPKKVPASTLHAHALDWLRGHGDRPFFLYLQSMDVHFPYDPPSPYREMFLGPPPDPEIVRKLQGSVTPEVWRTFTEVSGNMNPDRYDGAIAYADHEIGAFLDELDRSGLGERTVVVVTADHGEPLGDRGELLHGRSLFEELVHVPLIVRLPWMASGAQVDDVVSHMDLAPTLLDLAGIPIVSQFVGRSLFAPGSARRPPSATGELVHASTYVATGWFARQGPWKVIMSPTRLQLFDLESDPKETRDVSADHPDESRYLATLATARPNALGPRPANQGVEDGLTDAQKRQRRDALRALGYVE